jgi:hypothetical protein
MKTKRILGLLLTSFIIAFLAVGCASPTHSFNKDFNEKSPIEPKYAIDNVNDTEFKIRVFQGSPMTGPDRIVYMKEAASAISDAEAKRRGWEQWQLNYIQERDQGWEHILVGEVIRLK